VKKYRRIEVNAYHRRVTVVSGEWRPRDLFDAQPTETNGGVSIDDTAVCEPIPPDSPEGQLILLEAMRSLEQRLSPEARALTSDQIALIPNTPSPWFKLRSFYQFIRPNALRFARKEK